MTPAEFAVYFGLTLIGFVLSAMYSGLETGLYTLNSVRLTLRASRGEPSALRLRREMRNPSRVLVVLLIGTNGANYLGSYGLAALLHGWGFTDWTLIALEAAIFTPLVFVFAETLPKDLFRTHTDHWTYWLATVISLTRWVLMVTAVLPIVHGFVIILSRLAGSPHADRATARQRISQLIKEGVGAGVLTVAQTTLADRALAIRDQRISTLMVPWHSVVTLSLEADRQTRERLMHSRNFTRMPVVDRTGKVVGVLSWVDAILRPDQPTSDLMQPTLTLSSQRRLPEALSRMRRKRQTIAVVVAPKTDRPVGLVTLKDLVEPLTGELSEW